MKEKELKFDHTCHVLYSKSCKKQIQDKIILHYPPEQKEEIWTRIQLQYVEFLKDWRTDLGGKKNFHNGAGGTYDCIALMAYYVVCKDVTSLEEIEEMEGNLFLPAFRKLKFVNVNKPIFKRLMHFSFSMAEKKCKKWNDYKMVVASYQKDKPIYYEFTECPVAEFAKKNDLLEVMPAFCNPDYTAMELIHARLIRNTTCSNGCKCDYTICGDEDSYCKQYPEYQDKQGYRRNNRR